MLLVQAEARPRELRATDVCWDLSGEEGAK